MRTPTSGFRETTCQTGLNLPQHVKLGKVKMPGNSRLESYLRRDNLLFAEIPEVNEEKCVETVKDFIHNTYRYPQRKYNLPEFTE